jgi:hypothetical protein
MVLKHNVELGNDSVDLLSDLGQHGFDSLEDGSVEEVDHLLEEAAGDLDAEVLDTNCGHLLQLPVYLVVIDYGLQVYDKRHTSGVDTAELERDEPESVDGSINLHEHVKT